MSITALPYEILRRDDGRCALSINAGLIDFVPNHVIALEDDFVVLGLDKRPNFKLCKVPQDVRDRLTQDGHVSLFEFVSTGLFAAHRLHMVKA